MLAFGRLILLAGAVSGAWAADASPTPAELLDEAIEAEAANAEGLHRYVFFETRLVEHVGGRGKVWRRKNERYSVAWIDGREIPELVSVNGKKPKKRDVERRKQEVERLLERIAEERAERDKPSQGLTIPGWHVYAGTGGREERHTFSIAGLDADEFELELLDEGSGICARPSEEAMAQREAGAPALFEHRVWLDPQERAWVRWEARALSDGPVLGEGSRQTMTRVRVENDIWIEDSIERSWLDRLSDSPGSNVSRVDARVERYGFRRFFDVESAIEYQEAVLDEK